MGLYIYTDEGASLSLTSHTHRRNSSRSENVEASGRISGATPKASSSCPSNPPCSLHLLPLLHAMPNQAAASERVDEQPQQEQQQEQQQESFDSTKRFHIAFTSFKLLVITHINSQNTEPLSLAVLQFYIICEAIYLITLIKVTGPKRPNLIYRSLYIVFGTLDSELLLWTSLSLVIWLVVNLCLLVFVLASSGLLTQAFDHFRGIVKLFEDVVSSRV